MPRRKKSEKSVEESNEEEINFSEEEITSKPPETTPEPSEKKKSYVGLLVFLIIILIVLDLASLYLYYKPEIKIPDFFKFKQAKVVSEPLKCADETPYNQCSKNKPYYCYNGNLLRNANMCGCPEGYEINFQSCKKVNSS